MGLNVGCAAAPGRARDNKTGSWRVFKPVFKYDKCVKCGLCEVVCPEGCVHEGKDGYYHPDYNYCKGCGLCAEECPVDDIELVQEEK